MTKPERSRRKRPQPSTAKRWRWPREWRRVTSGRVGAISGVLALIIASVALFHDSFHSGTPNTRVRVSTPGVAWWLERPLRRIEVEFFITNDSRHDESVSTAFALFTNSDRKHVDVINVTPEGVPTTATEALTLTPGERRGYSALFTLSGLEQPLGANPWVEAQVRTGDGRMWTGKTVTVRLPPPNPLGFPVATTP